MPAGASTRVVVGLVRGVHGLRGALRVEVLTDVEERFAPGSVLHPEGEERSLRVAWVQQDGPGLLVRFDEVRTREAADELRDRYLEADATRHPLPEGSVYWHELEGVEVTTTGGESLGRVADVFRAGGGEVYVVRGGARGELLVPGVAAVVREFAPREGRIVVDAEALDLAEPRPRRPRGRRSSKRPPGEAPAP
ncbi:MAG TPA: ribosome maturation factor RimM [Candidatus Limnocylindrales bacterium]|nr:ribosome maturation factor RimM [Candidatus Limnocylindrales bacterium]